MQSVTRVASIAAAFLLIGAVVSPAVASSNKTIQIDEDLRVNADVLNVIIGTSTPANQVNIKFGEYSVVSSNVREGRQTTTSEFLSPVTHTRIRNYFTFVLTGAAGTTAKVKAEWNILSEKPGQCLEIDLGVGAGIEYCTSDEEPQPGVHDLVVAIVRIDGETASRWTLLLDAVRSRSGLTERAGTSFLTDGSRQIVIRPVTSAGPAKNLLDLPARGYEFWEAGQSIGAVQYYAGGALGLHKNVVHLRRDIDPQLKLLLASAMTTIMEYKLEALFDYED